MRARLGRQIRQSGNSTMGALDWGSILTQVAQAAPAVISAVKPKAPAPAPTSGGGGGTTTIYQQAPSKQQQTNYTPWLIGGGLGLAALLAFTLKSKRK